MQPGKAAVSEFDCLTSADVRWDKFASSTGPPYQRLTKRWWAGAAKRRLSHPTGCFDFPLPDFISFRQNLCFTDFSQFAVRNFVAVDHCSLVVAQSHLLER
jgi:hypothetical protein